MQIAVVGAGFSPGKADSLRRSMATFKRTGGVGKFREEFLNGMKAKKYPAEFAEACFRQIEGFGSYGSRATVMGGSAIMLAAKELLTSFRTIAARRLSVDPGQLGIVDGVARAPDGRSLTFGEVGSEERLCAEGSFANSSKVSNR